MPMNAEPMPVTSRPIHFIRRGEAVTLNNVPPTRTLLQVLREDLHCTGTKEGCNEGDCGACTVVLAELDPKATDGLRYQSVNSCIRFAHSIDGKALWTVEDLAQADGTLHPAQQAMVDNFGSQCGFCTPGFVMSLFATYQNRVRRGETVTRESAQHDLSGNLCRCTGYRPILDAAVGMSQYKIVPEKTSKTLELLKQIIEPIYEQNTDSSYDIPKNIDKLLQIRSRKPAAQLVAGCTDVGLWVNKLHMDFAQVIDVTQVAELRQVARYPHHIAIGAAVSLNDAFAALLADRPELTGFAHRFAGLPVRNSGTLGGNVANGSPIGDSMPLLIALQASLVLMRWADGGMAHREMRVEDFYTGYRKNRLQPDEVLAWIKVPLPQPGAFLRAYKISKRFEDDISAVCLVVNLTLANGKVLAASVGAGGVAATPVRAFKTEAFLGQKAWTQVTATQAQAVLRAEFSPISDMRASAAYRSQVLGNLLQRLWLESQGQTGLNLESALEAIQADDAIGSAGTAS